MTAHAHSAASLAGERQSGRLGRRAEAVLRALHEAVAPLTDRQVAEQLGFADLNGVRPRITELIALGLAAEAGQTQCAVTRKTVRLVRATTAAERAAAEQRTEFQPELSLSFASQPQP